MASSSSTRSNFRRWMPPVRADEFVIEMVEAVIAEGATIINLPDTMGYAMPEEYERMFRTVRQQARGGDKVSYSAHCHNDLGLAVANSLAAIRGGATQIEVTVNGIGERAGNCSLEELVMAIETRKDPRSAQRRESLSARFMKRPEWSAGRCISRLRSTSRSSAAMRSSMSPASIRTAC